MFGAQKKSPPIRSLIGEGTVVQGDLTFTEGLRIDGEVHGDVTGPAEASSILIISDHAQHDIAHVWLYQTTGCHDTDIATFNPQRLCVRHCCANQRHHSVGLSQVLQFGVIHILLSLVKYSPKQSQHRRRLQWSASQQRMNLS